LAEALQYRPKTLTATWSPTHSAGIGDALPLSEEGLQALQAQQDWWETDTISDEKMLIYNRPVIVESEVAYIVQVAHPLTERDRTLQSFICYHFINC